MYGRQYTVAIGAQAQTTAVTLVEIAAPADAVVVIEKIRISQSSYDSSEVLGVKIEDITTTGTGTTSTAVPKSEGDPAFGGTVKTNMTVEPTYSGTVYEEDAFNVLSGYTWTPISDDDPIVISPSQIVGIMLDVAPSTSMNFSYTVTFREIGG